MLRNEIDIKCPNCGSKEKVVQAFGREDFRYKCLKCGINYLVHYEIIPTSIEQLSGDMPNAKIEDSFMKEYECHFEE